MRTVLSLVDPPVYFTPPCDLITSILANAGEYQKYDLLEQFIEMVHSPDNEEGWVEFYGFDNPKNFPSLDHMIVPRDYILSKGNIVDIVKDLLDLGYYLLVNISVKEIRAYHMENGGHHELCIYGYDDEQSLFLIRDYFDITKWAENTCSYNELVNAFTLYNFPDYLRGILALKPRANCDLGLNTKTIISKLQMTLTNTNPCVKIKHTYGICFFDKVLSGIDDSEHNREVLRIRHYNFLFAHMYHMDKRLSYYYAIHPENESLKQLVNISRELLASMKRLRLMVLVYNKRIMTTPYKEGRYDTIRKLTSKILWKYKETLNDFLQCLKMLYW